MASIVSDPNGRKRILFVDTDGQRRPIRLGKATMKQAEAFKVKIEQLVSAKVTGVMEDETSRWIVGLDDTMHDRLSRAGLVKSRKLSRMTLGQFIDTYIADRTDTKPRTIINLKQARKDLMEFFSADKPLKEITEGDADEFWRYLLRRGLADNTARRICGRAKQFFRAAIRKHLVQNNPFADLKCHVQRNADRYYFVTREQMTKLIAACPDAQWKLLIALVRIGGLRCPSECLALRWGDVDWKANRITVRSSKTEQYEGKGSRIIPLFPELRDHLLPVFGREQPAEAYVITRYRDCNANLRTQFCRIVSRAGLEPWPQLFHNMRRSRQNELEREFGTAVACQWIGNSEAVAQEHYFYATEADFAQALGGEGESDEVPENAAHNAAQQAAEGYRTEQKSNTRKTRNRPELPVGSMSCDTPQVGSVPPRGVEPLSSG